MRADEKARTGISSKEVRSDRGLPRREHQPSIALHKPRNLTRHGHLLSLIEHKRKGDRVSPHAQPKNATGIICQRICRFLLASNTELPQNSRSGDLGPDFRRFPSLAQNLFTLSSPAEVPRRIGDSFQIRPAAYPNTARALPTSSAMKSATRLTRRMARRSSCITSQ